MCQQRESERETYVGHVVKSTTLRDSDERGLVVRRGVNGGDAVSASGETAGDGGGEDAVLSLVVETLEEDELGGVRGRLLVKRGELLDDDV